MTFGKRLNSLIIALNCKSITSFEDQVGVSRKTFSKVIKEGTDTGCKNILKIWTNFPNVNLHWLLTGCGDMFIDMVESAKLYPQNVEIHSLVAETPIEILKDEYIKDLKDHIASLKTEIDEQKDMLRMFKEGDIIVTSKNRD